MALEEPQNEDVRFEVEGLPLAASPDVAVLLTAYEGATLDHNPQRIVHGPFYVHFGRRAWGC
ncbi:MAG: hypothetical protein QUU85_19390 [Candidatus Eisenbacteria bacterium]|nr:hypothetical protein [Candidatus Eisenbacteria bacterium]